MTSAPAPFFEPPDLIAALPERPFEFSEAAGREADSIVAGPATALFQRLIRDQETESTWLVARRVLDTFLGSRLRGGPGRSRRRTTRARTRSPSTSPGSGPT